MNLRIVSLSVSVVVVVILLAGLLMPVIEDSTHTTEIITNEGYNYRVTKNITEATTYTLGDDNALLINDDPAIINTPNSGASVGLSDPAFGMAWTTADTFWVASPDAAKYANVSSVTINPDGSWSYLVNDVETSSTDDQKLTDYYAVTNDGEYAAFYGMVSSSFAVNEGTALIVSYNYGMVTTGGVFPAFIRGTIVGSTVTVDYAYYYADGVKTNIDFSITLNGTVETENGVTYYKNVYITHTNSNNLSISARPTIVADMTYSLTTENNDNITGILKAIPVFVVLALIVAIAAAVLYNRD